MPPAAAVCNMAIHCSALGATWPRSITISVSTSTPSCRCTVSSSSGCRSKDNIKCALDAAPPRRRSYKRVLQGKTNVGTGMLVALLLGVAVVPREHPVLDHQEQAIED